MENPSPEQLTPERVTPERVTELRLEAKRLDREIDEQRNQLAQGEEALRLVDSETKSYLKEQESKKAALESELEQLLSERQKLRNQLAELRGHIAQAEEAFNQRTQERERELAGRERDIDAREATTTATEAALKATEAAQRSERLKLDTDSATLAGERQGWARELEVRREELGRVDHELYEKTITAGIVEKRLNDLLAEKEKVEQLAEENLTQLNSALDGLTTRYNQVLQRSLDLYKDFDKTKASLKAREDLLAQREKRIKDDEKRIRSERAALVTAKREL